MKTPRSQAHHAWKMANHMGHLWAGMCPPSTWGNGAEVDWSDIAARARAAATYDTDVIAPRCTETRNGVVLWHVSGRARLAWGVGVEGENVIVAVHVLRPTQEDLPGVPDNVDLAHTALRVVWRYYPAGFMAPSVQVGPAACYSRHIEALWLAVSPLEKGVPLADICWLASSEEEAPLILGLPVVLSGQGPGIIGDPWLVEEGNPLIWIG